MSGPVCARHPPALTPQLPGLGPISSFTPMPPSVAWPYGLLEVPRFTSSRGGVQEARLVLYVLVTAPMLLVFLTVLWSFLWVYAQNTSVSCSSTYDWMLNPMGQSPCLTAAWLQFPCVGHYEVGRATYLGPSNGTAQSCECNTVFYSALAACAVCQGAGLGGISPWPSFSKNCPSVTIQQYPRIIPNGTSIPGWAYIPLFNNTLNVKAAQYLASLYTVPTSSVNSSASSTLVPPTSTSTLLPASSTSAANFASASPSPTAPHGHSSYLESGGLVGVMVVSLLGLSAAITIIVVLARRKWLPHIAPPPSDVRVPSLIMPDLRMPALRMPTIRMPALHLPTLRIPTLPMPALRMPVLRIPPLRMPTVLLPARLRRRRHPPPSTDTEGKPPMFYNPDDPRTFPPLPSPEEIYFYRCRQKAAANPWGCDKSYTDVTFGGALPSTIGSTLVSYPLLPSPLRGHNWRPEGEV